MKSLPIASTVFKHFKLQHLSFETSCVIRFICLKGERNMDVNWNIFCISVLLMYCTTKTCIHGAPTKGGIVNKELTGQELIKMGNMLNKPELSLIGATFVKTGQILNKDFFEKINATDKNLKEMSAKIGATEKNLKDSLDFLTNEICKQSLCAAWTLWSRCSAAYTTGTFGARTRSRTCGGISTICSTKTAETVETDHQICEGKTCQHTLTNNRYCIKFYNSVKKTQKDAEDDCHKDGGHLMNIDSALKAKDIEEYFKSISFTTAVWIDGRRTLPNGEWIYKYGSNDTTFSMWYNTEPDSTDDCKVFDINSGKWYWWGRPCESIYLYLCEIF